MSAAKLFWARVHAEPAPAGLETREYNLRWGNMLPVHANTQREAKEIALHALHGSARVQVFTTGDVGRMILDEHRALAQEGGARS